MADIPSGESVIPARRATESRLFDPLRHTDFRRIWLASLPQNFGFMISGIGAGWSMTEMSGRADRVALVQAALNVPFMLFAVPAGAIGDVYDRRKVCAIAVACAMASALALFLLGWMDRLTPAILLTCCFLIGCGNAFFGPVWQSSVPEQVPPRDMPSGVALNSMSYSIARSVGPAIGGVLTAIGGAMVAFGTAALGYLPMIAAQLMWRRELETPKQPPEQVGRAVMSGLRYVFHSPAIRSLIVRTFIFGIGTGALLGLMPLVSRDLLNGGAQTYGLLLGAFGVGSVLGAPLVGRLRHIWPIERHVSIGMAAVGLMIAALAMIRSPWLAYPALVVAGVGYVNALTNLNVTVQTHAPRWVSGRAQAAYQAAMAGGVAIGAWVSGELAEATSTSATLALGGGITVAGILLGRISPLSNPRSDPADVLSSLSEPAKAIPLSGRSGPLTIAIEYKVPNDAAPAFRNAMMEVSRIRKRNGAFSWSLARDIAEPDAWIEQFSCATWDDYLRQRGRMTAAEREVLKDIQGGKGVRQARVRRWLGRPYGSSNKLTD